jgi:hypothetical protein
VGITGGNDGLTLASSTGTFTLTNVSITPGGIGVTINGGTANVSATNLTVTTTGSTGILANGTGTLTIGGTSSFATTNGTALDLTNHTLAISLTSVSASNAVNGIRLTNTPGSFIVNGTGGAGSGGTITGMSTRGVNATNAGALTLRSMNINNSVQQGVWLDNSLATASSLTVQASSFTGNNIGVQTLHTGSGAMTVTVNASTFTNNGGAVTNQSTLGPLTTTLTNNTTTFNSTTPFIVTRNSGATGAVNATITGNTVGALGVPNSGAVCGGSCGGISVQSSGSNAFNALISNNVIRQIDLIGIRALANQGSSAMNLTITNNQVIDPVAGVLFGINVQSGSLAADTNAVCAGITGNTVSGGFTTDVAVRNTSAGSTFRLPGYAGLGTDTTAVANFIKANNPITTATATRKTTVPANQFTGGAACATPAP